MAPKTRSSSSAATKKKKKVVVTTTTKKIVKQTVLQKVVVSPAPEKEKIGHSDSSGDVGKLLDILSQDQSEEIKVSNSSSPVLRRQQRSPSRKIVVVEYKEKTSNNDNNEEEEEEIQPALDLTPPMYEASPSTPRRQPPSVKKVIVEGGNKATESNDDEQETQPASEAEVTALTSAPTPPKHEVGPPTRKILKEEEEEKSKNKRKRKRKGRVSNELEYKRYVYRVMKQVHPEMGISTKAMTIINNLMTDMFERISEEAAKLCKYVGKATLTAAEIQDAVKLVIPGELGKHAVAEGAKAVTNYYAAVTKKNRIAGGRNSKYGINSKP